MSDRELQGNGAYKGLKDRDALTDVADTNDFIETISRFSRLRKISDEELQDMRENGDRSKYESSLSENELFDSEDFKIKSLISEGVDVNANDVFGESALVIIIKAWSKTFSRTTSSSFLGTIKLLLDYGANPNAVNTRDETVLLTAIRADRSMDPGHKEKELELLIRMLVGYGADVNLGAPLNAAVQEKEIEIVRFLLSKGAKTDVQVEGETPLLSALLARNSFNAERELPIIKILLDHGADIKNNKAELLKAAVCNCSKSVECLLEHCYGRSEPKFCPVDERLEPWDHPKDKETIVLFKSDAKSREVGDSQICIPVGEEGANFCPKEMKTLASQTFKGNGPTPKVGSTCFYCSKFEKEAVQRQWFTHSPDSSTLQRAILDGCLMCQLIKDCLPDTFGAVSLFYYSADSVSSSRNYYERIIVRSKVLHEFMYGELRLAAIDDEIIDLLKQANEDEGRNTNSEPSLQLAKHWMRTCITHHGTSCQASRDQLPTLPTRVIDVSDASKDPYLLISNGQGGYYTTLSYCWGSAKNLSTMSHSMEAFQKSIPFQDIPKTIQDAITATRKLGIHYLWVDTLCILQDSKEDWLREAKAMANIYRNSALTIAAADSEDSGGGLFRDRARLRTRPVQFAPQVAPFLQSSSRERVLTFGDRQESNDAFKPLCRLDTRGWVLQEQLLSPRILNFSSQELYWECPSLLASESYLAGIPPDHDRNLERYDFSALKRMLSETSSSQNQARAHILWQRLVVLYSKRYLTHQKDKLVALAGAADQVSKLLDDTLLVGLWKKWLWRDLLWTVDRETTFPFPFSPFSKEFKAPSWSWASITRPISYKFPGGTSYFRYNPCIQVLRYGEKVHQESMNMSGFIEIRGAMLPVISQSYIRPASDIITGKPLQNEGKNVDILIPTWPTPSRRRSSQSLFQEFQKNSDSMSETTSESEDDSDFEYDPEPGINPRTESDPQLLSWVPDTERAINGPLQCLIVASSQLYVIFLVLAPTGRRPDEYCRKGVAYWNIFKAENAQIALGRRPGQPPLSFPDELNFQILTIV